LSLWFFICGQEFAMSHSFELPQELTIYSAVDTRDALLAWVAEQTAKSSTEFDISAAKVAEIDGSGLQLLTALSHLPQPWRLVNPSQAVTNACATLGLANWLVQHS